MYNWEINFDINSLLKSQLWRDKKKKMKKVEFFSNIYLSINIVIYIFTKKNYCYIIYMVEFYILKQKQICMPDDLFFGGWDWLLKPLKVVFFHLF